MPHDPVRDPIPSSAREILELFRNELAEVRFPDLDRGVLTSAEREVLDAQRVLEEAESALERARAELGERTGHLLAKTQRALAYARIFADEDPTLRERLSAIALHRSPRTSEPMRASLGESGAPAKKRGRPRKTAPQPEDSLFGGHSPSGNPMESLGA